MANKEFLVIIPARGGSKGIPRKNIVNIAGRPLIDFTIKPALRLLNEGTIDEVIVSTDDQEIANMAEKLGIRVPFLRPKEIASDTSKSVEYVLHVLDFFAKRDTFFQSVIILQPTSPLRSAEDVTQAIKLFRNGKCSTLISVYREESYNSSILYHKNGNFAVPLDKNHNKGGRRQDGIPVYVRNGAIYICNSQYVMSFQQLIGDQVLLFEMPKERSLNIDTQEDLEYLRWIISK